MKKTNKLEISKEDLYADHKTMLLKKAPKVSLNKYYYCVNTFNNDEPVQLEGYVEAASEEAAIRELVTTGVVDSQGYEFLELKAMDGVDSGLMYGIVKEFENGTTLWYEPITDVVDGFVFRKQDRSIIRIWK